MLYIIKISFYEYKMDINSFSMLSRECIDDC